MYIVKAEDGIRELVRSRGLGDEYTRQALRKVTAGQELTEVETIVFRCAVHLAQRTLNGYVDQ